MFVGTGSCVGGSGVSVGAGGTVGSGPLVDSFVGDGVLDGAT